MPQDDLLDPSADPTAGPRQSREYLIAQEKKRQEDAAKLAAAQQARYTTTDPDIIDQIEGKGTFRRPEDLQRMRAQQPGKLLDELEAEKGAFSPGKPSDAPIREGVGAAGERFFTNLPGTPKGGVEGSFHPYGGSAGGGTLSNVGGRADNPEREQLLREIEDEKSATGASPKSADVVGQRVAKLQPEFEQMFDKQGSDAVDEEMRQRMEKGTMSAPEVALMKSHLGDKAEAEVFSYVEGNRPVAEKVARQFGTEAAIDTFREGMDKPGELTPLELKGRIRLINELRARSVDPLNQQAMANPGALPRYVMPNQYGGSETMNSGPATVLNPGGVPGAGATADEAHANTVDQLVNEGATTPALGPGPTPTVYQLANRKNTAKPAQGPATYGRKKKPMTPPSEQGALEYLGF